MKKGVVNAFARFSTVLADNKSKRGLSPKDAIMTINQCMGNVTSKAAARPAGKTAIQRKVFIVGSIGCLGRHVNSLNGSPRGALAPLLISSPSPIKERGTEGVR